MRQTLSDDQYHAYQKRHDGGEAWEDLADEAGLINGDALRNACLRNKKRHVGETPTPHFEDWVEPEDVDWRDVLSNASANQDLSKRIDPRQEHLTITIDTDRPIAIPFSADLHMGGGFTDHKAVKRTLELILETPGMYFTANGDMIEGFIPGEKSAETVEQMPLGMRQQLAANRSIVQEFVDAKKLLWWMWGDHDAKWFEKLVGVNILKVLTDKVVPYFNQAATVSLKVGGEDYLIYVNHSLPGNSMYNRNHAQGRAYREQIPADVIVSGHTHKPAIQWEYRYEKLREMGYGIGGKTTYVQCGTFKTGPDPYTCRFWSRGIIGVPTLIFWPTEHKILALDNPEDAAVHLQGLSQNF